MDGIDTVLHGNGKDQRHHDHQRRKDIQNRPQDQQQQIQQYQKDDFPGDVDAVLDYYLKLEKYRDDYDAFIDCVGNDDTYANAWRDYESGVGGFRIPGLVTWVDDAGEFSLTNVPVGHTYTIYRSVCNSGTCSANTLPGAFTSIPGDGIIAVTADQAGQILPVP